MCTRITIHLIASFSQLFRFSSVIRSKNGERNRGIQLWNGLTGTIQVYELTRKNGRLLSNRANSEYNHDVEQRIADHGVGKSSEKSGLQSRFDVIRVASVQRRDSVGNRRGEDVPMSTVPEELRPEERVPEPSAFAR